MAYEQINKLMKEFWDTRDTKGCGWRISRNTPTMPCYVFVYKGDTMMRRIGVDGFSKMEINDMLETVARLAK